MNILELQRDRFNIRITLGGCMININGGTVDCDLSLDTTNPTSPTYTVKRKLSEEILCTFRPYHLYAFSNVRVNEIYMIEGASNLGGTAALIVPLHGLFDDDEDDEIASDEQDLDVMMTSDADVSLESKSDGR